MQVTFVVVSILLACAASISSAEIKDKLVDSKNSKPESKEIAAAEPTELQEVDLKDLDDGTEEDEEIKRKKKSTTTTFCVEIRPSGDQKPFQVCEPGYAQSPQAHYPQSAPTYGQESQNAHAAPYQSVTTTQNQAKPAAAYSSPVKTYGANPAAPANKPYTPHSYTSYRSNDDMEAEETVMRTNPDSEEEDGPSTEDTNMRSAYDPQHYSHGYGVPHPSYLPHAHKKPHNHNGLVITCQPNLAGYAHNIPNYGNAPAVPSYNYRAASGRYGRPYQPYRPQQQPYGSYQHAGKPANRPHPTYNQAPVAPSYNQAPAASSYQTPEAPSYPAPQPAYSQSYAPQAYKQPSYPSAGYKAPVYTQKPAAYQETAAQPQAYAAASQPQAYAAPAPHQPTYTAPAQPQTYTAPAPPHQPTYAAPAQAQSYAAQAPAHQQAYAAPAQPQNYAAAPPAHQQVYAAPTPAPAYAAPAYQAPAPSAPAVSPPAYYAGPGYVPPATYREAEGEEVSTTLDKNDKESQTLKKIEEISEQRATGGRWGTEMAADSKDLKKDEQMRASGAWRAAGGNWGAEDDARGLNKDEHMATKGDWREADGKGQLGDGQKAKENEVDVSL